VADATSQHPLSALEIVLNGHVVAREEGHGAHELHLEARLQIASDGWVAARCIGPAATYQPPWARWPITTAAHTSPVYLTGTGRMHVNEDNLTYLMTVVSGGLMWLDTLATHADPVSEASVRSTFLAARERLARMRASPA
jgi:hypothetical protein